MIKATNKIAALIFGLLTFSVQSTTHNLQPVSSYLNFYQLNINRCEEIYPEKMSEANEARLIVQPYLESLHKSLKKDKLNDTSKNSQLSMSMKISEQIAESELTSDHCSFIFEIARTGLDRVLLKRIKNSEMPDERYESSDLTKEICNYIATNDKNRLRKKLRTSKIKLRNVYDGLTCNGLSLLQFSMKKDAVSLGLYIVKRLPSSHLKNSPEINWANRNGFSDSKIIKSIKARIGI